MFEDGKFESEQERDEGCERLREGVREGEKERKKQRKKERKTERKKERKKDPPKGPQGCADAPTTTRVLGCATNVGARNTAE